MLLMCLRLSPTLLVVSRPSATAASPPAPGVEGPLVAVVVVLIVLLVLPLGTIGAFLSRSPICDHIHLLKFDSPTAPGGCAWSLLRSPGAENATTSTSRDRPSRGSLGGGGGENPLPHQGWALPSPDIRCHDVFNTWSLEVPTTSPGLASRPGSIFDAPGALRWPPEAENTEKPPP